jgi:type I restriction enzyme S subunit
MSLSKKLVPELRFSGFNDNWESKNLEEIILTKSLGGNYSNSENKTDKPLIKMGNIDRGFIKLDKLEYIKKGQIVDEDHRIKKHDLFFNTRNTLDLVGKVAIWRNELEVAYYNSNLMRIEFENNLFMNYKLNSYNGLKKLKRIATGTTSVAAIYTKDLIKINLTIPTLKEQQKIASFLSQVDTKIDLLNQKVDQLELYKKGVMQKLFSQEIRFKPDLSGDEGEDNGKAFPEWEEKRLGEIATKKSSNISANKIEDNQGEYKIYGANGLLKYIDFYEVKEEFISIVKDGAGVGRVLLCDAYSSVLATLDVIKPKISTNIYFLYSLLSRFRFERYTTGSTIPHIYFKDYSKQKIKIPTLNEQDKIANFLSAIDQKIDYTQQQLEQTKMFKKGLLQKMFV